MHAKESWHWPEDTDPLRKDYGRALSCYERALLFASKRPEPSIFFSAPTPQAGQQDAGPDAASSSLDQHGRITSIYDEAGRMLHDRLEETYVDYLKIESQGRALNIKLADRDPVFIKDSRELVWDSFKELLSVARSRGSAKPPRDIDHYRSDWEGLNNICRLLMEEISFLRSRIDSFVNIQTAIKRLQWAWRAIGIAAVFSTLSWLLAFHREWPDLKTEASHLIFNASSNVNPVKQ